MENYIVNAPNEQEKYKELIQLEKLGKLSKVIMPMDDTWFQTYLTHEFDSDIIVHKSKSIINFYNRNNILEYSTIVEKGISHPYFSLTVHNHEQKL
ncbi:hypothetical protein [Maribacter luteus]|uniref:hypothetical protein n=1 Tax=Maribacter luteus TaxID=2594478 RepID=UPI0024937F34|nr:hypothetical protein [Maribacter luteus]